MTEWGWTALYHLIVERVAQVVHLAVDALGLALSVIFLLALSLLQFRGGQDPSLRSRRAKMANARQRSTTTLATHGIMPPDKLLCTSMLESKTFLRLKLPIGHTH